MLATIDLNKNLERQEYKKQLLGYQVELRELAFRCYQQGQPVLLVFEGWDAAGKGGSIRRLTEKLDPRGYHVYSIAAPEGDDKHHHYLWRFWRRLLPVDEKQLVIFDRSWYGRVLVERVENFASKKEWKRAYREINHFESQLTDQGYVLLKYWFHIDPEEQMRRFEARRHTPHKSWKLTEEDFRNREKWSEYEIAVNDMLAKTSTENAPWAVVEGNDKYYARVKCIRHLVEKLGATLDAV